jgi:hypothetical protein
MATIGNSSPPQESESYSQEQYNLTVEKPSELNICMLQAQCNNQNQ